MKKLISAIACFGIIVLAASPIPGAADISGNLTLSGAWALYPMALKWVEEFQKVHPGVRIDVQAGGAGKGIADALAGMVDIGMVSRNVQPVELEKGAFPVAVTKDAVIPTLSARNPVLK
ncbi:MAG: substrate-binding domain-containing protein, partial [Candidatus Aminicenantes bacterium]|nr:substrate-binding domain-containing protein [Candidatus Aminicenantes bacterium]